MIKTWLKENIQTLLIGAFFLIAVQIGFYFSNLRETNIRKDLIICYEKALEKGDLESAKIFAIQISNIGVWNIDMSKESSK